MPAPDAGGIRFQMPSRARPGHWRGGGARGGAAAMMRGGAGTRMRGNQPGMFQQQGMRMQQQQQQSQQGSWMQSKAPDWDQPNDISSFPARPQFQNNNTAVIRPTMQQPASAKKESRWSLDASKPTAWNSADQSKPVVDHKESSNAGTAAGSGRNSASVSSEDWPKPLKEYVHRCFGSVSDDSLKDRMEAFLKSILTSAFNDGSAYTRNWDSEPIPSLGGTSSSTSALSPREKSRQVAYLPLSSGKLRGSGSGRGGRRGGRRNWSPPGFRRRSRSHSRSRSRDRSNSGSRSSGSRSSRRRQRGKRRNRY